jgi:hypothetical protein
VKKKFIKRRKIMKDKPIILVRLGDKEKGWIPSNSYFKAFLKMAKKTGITKKFNIIVFHYGIDIQLLGTKEQLKDYGLEIVDEAKFTEFISIYTKEEKK